MSYVLVYAMKKIILIVFLVSISYFSYASDDGGWSSSGGGEFVTNQHNPWFFRHIKDKDKKVTWCIDHGGEKNFSLSIDKAREEVETALNMIGKEIEEGFPIHRCPYYSKASGRFLAGFCSHPIINGDPYALYLNTKYSYQEKCDDKADLTFVLGNPSSSNFQKLVSKQGKARATKFGGVAIRTKYELSENFNIESKGFIYIAADRGEYRYSGVGASIGARQSRDIWTYRYLGETTGNEQYLVHPHIKQEKEIASPFLATVLHELGHVYGFKHRTVEPGSNLTSSFNTVVRQGDEIFWLDGYNLHIMDESFVPKVISNGGIPKYSLRNSMGHFGLGVNKNAGIVSFLDRTKFIYEDIRIAIRLRTSSLGLIDSDLYKALKDQQTLFFEIGEGKIALSGLKFNKKIFPCIQSVDYAGDFDDEVFPFKSAKECFDHHKANDPGKFEMVKTPLGEAPFLIDSWSKREKDSMKLQIVNSHVSDFGFPFTVQSALNLITFYEKSFSFKVELQVEEKTVPYMVRLYLDSDGLNSNLEMINLESLRISRVNNEGLFFFDRKKPGAPLPTFFE